MSWGNKLLVTFLVFAGGMAFLVYRSMHVNFELVEKDYYKSELQYQQVIDATNKGNQLSSPVALTQTDGSILLEMPREMKDKQVEGEIWFYCSYNQQNDRKYSLKLDVEGRQQFSSPAIAPGNYSVKISWASEGQHYFCEKKMNVL
jgi:hypothetical protein